MLRRLLSCNKVNKNRNFSTFYTKEHEWISIINNKATIGITDYAQSQLGDLVFVEYSDVKDIKKGDIVASIESVKASSDIYSPIDCKLLEMNDELIDNPELINQSPEEDGWLIKVEVDEIDRSNLLTNKEYEDFIE